MPRDPRLDPQPGDRVRMNGRTRYVLMLDGNDVWFIIEEEDQALDKRVSLASWRSWCRPNKAEAVKEAPDA